jgi:hypothetical protein
MRLYRSALIFTLAGLGVQAPGLADITFGGNARAQAMGGAGIAVVDRSERTTPVNPAALALFNRRLGHLQPNISLHAHGIPIRESFDHLFGNPDRNDATSLARDFGKRDSDFGTNLGLGVRFGHMDARAWGVGLVRVLPNAALQTWAKSATGASGAPPPPLTGAERADLFGAAVYSIPTVGIAERVSPAGSPTRIEAGARIKLQRAVYSHYIVTSQNIANNTPAQRAPELGAGTTLTKDSVGVDFGLLAHPRLHDGFSGALVVTNLIEPGFRFMGTDVNGNPKKYHLQPRSISIGGAYESGKFLAAFDAVDLTRAYSDVQGRVGVEYVTRRVALRAGYSSARGFTAGFGWGWLELAFGNRVPLMVTETLRF